MPSRISSPTALSKISLDLTTWIGTRGEPLPPRHAASLLIKVTARYRKLMAPADTKEHAPEASPRASLSSQAPSLAPRDYFGVYTDKAYGNVTVCPLPSSSSPKPFPCQSLYARLDGALPITAIPPAGAETNFDFLIDKPGIDGASHIFISHRGGATWSGQYGFVFGPTAARAESVLGYGTFHASEVEVDFVIEEGKVVGMEWSGVWGAGPDVAKRAGEVEVKFSKVR